MCLGDLKQGLIGGEFGSHSCSADSCPQGKEENETFCEKQENRFENRFRPEKSPTGTIQGGTKLSAIKKKSTNLDLRSDLGANEKRVLAESGLGGGDRSLWFGSKLR